MDTTQDSSLNGAAAEQGPASSDSKRVVFESDESGRLKKGVGVASGVGRTREEINSIIEKASHGSEFAKNSAERLEDLQKKIDDILADKAKLNPSDIIESNTVVQKLTDELESNRVLDRIIVHVDMDAFYASCEELDRPDLKDKPMAVGERVLTTANYEARKYGCTSAMATHIALKLCPDLIVLKPNFDKYNRLSDQVRAVLCRYDPQYSPVGLDEAFLNITAFCKDNDRSATSVVSEIRAKIQEETNLTASAGIAPNKLLAKVCGEVNKPNGQFELINDRDVILDFLKTLPVRKIPGIGKVSGAILSALGCNFCGEMLEASLGIGSVEVARKVGLSKVRSRERTFGKEIRSVDQMMLMLKELAETLERDLDEEKDGVAGRTVNLKIKTSNFKVSTRAKTLARNIHKAEDIYLAASELLSQFVKENMPVAVRLLGIGLTNLISRSELNKPAIVFKKKAQAPAPILDLIESPCPICSKPLKCTVRQAESHVESCLIAVKEQKRSRSAERPSDISANASPKRLKTDKSGSWEPASLPAENRPPFSSPSHHVFSGASLIRHHDTEDTSLQCPICSKSIAKVDMLQDHITACLWEREARGSAHKKSSMSPSGASVETTTITTTTTTRITSAAPMAYMKTKRSRVDISAQMQWYQDGELEVPCPICSSEFKMKSMEDHIVACLMSSEGGSSGAKKGISPRRQGQVSERSADDGMPITSRGATNETPPDKMNVEHAVVDHGDDFEFHALGEDEEASAQTLSESRRAVIPQQRRSSGNAGPPVVITTVSDNPTSNDMNMEAHEDRGAVRHDADEEEEDEGDFFEPVKASEPSTQLESPPESPTLSPPVRPRIVSPAAPLPAQLPVLQQQRQQRQESRPSSSDPQVAQITSPFTPTSRPKIVLMQPPAEKVTTPTPSSRRRNIDNSTDVPTRPNQVSATKSHLEKGSASTRRSPSASAKSADVEMGGTGPTSTNSFQCPLCLKTCAMTTEERMLEHIEQCLLRQERLKSKKSLPTTPSGRRTTTTTRVSAGVLTQSNRAASNVPDRGLVGNGSMRSPSASPGAQVDVENIDTSEEDKRATPSAFATAQEDYKVSDIMEGGIGDDSFECPICLETCKGTSEALMLEHIEDCLMFQERATKIEERRAQRKLGKEPQLRRQEQRSQNTSQRALKVVSTGVQTMLTEYEGFFGGRRICPACEKFIPAEVYDEHIQNHLHEMNFSTG